MNKTRRSLIALVAGVSLSASAMSDPAPASAAPKTIFGLSEYVYIEELGVRYKAKIDTGAESASINAINAEVKESRDDDEPDMVHFDLVLPNGRLIVAGVNVVKKHVRANPNRGIQGGIVEQEAGIDASNVAIWNAKAEKADRVGFRVEDGRKVRFFKSSGEPLDA